MAETTLSALERNEFGKGAARRTRRAGLVPAVMHSHGEEPIHISLPGHATYLALRQANAVLDIELGGKSTLTIAREIQRHPVTDVLEHVDLMIVKKGEKIEADIPVRIEGEPKVGLALLDMQELRVRAEALNLPDHIAVSVDGLMDGATVTVGDLELPEGVEPLADLSTLVVTVTVPRMAEEETAAGEDEASEASDDGEETA